MAENKIGVVSCSGEQCLGGTISRLAVRKMMDEIHPDETVTICLPLYLAGGEEERSFARDYPTIAVDGCPKCCAKRATEKYSGKVSAAFDVSKIIGREKAEEGPLSTRGLTDEHKDMIDKVAKQISLVFEDVSHGRLNRSAAHGTGEENDPSNSCDCGCK